MRARTSKTRADRTSTRTISLSVTIAADDDDAATRGPSALLVDSLVMLAFDMRERGVRSIVGGECAGMPFDAGHLYDTNGNRIGEWSAMPCSRRGRN